MRNKKKKEQSPIGAAYLFVREPLNFPSSIMSWPEEIAGQLYGLLDNELIPVDAYAYTQDFYSEKIYRCLWLGEFVGIDFDNGKLSVWLDLFLQKPENREQANEFLSKKKN